MNVLKRPMNRDAGRIWQDGGSGGGGGARGNGTGSPEEPRRVTLAERTPRRNTGRFLIFSHFSLMVEGWFSRFHYK